MPRRQPLLRHFLGGPVGMPGEGMRQEMLLLHNVHGVPGATRLLPHPAAPDGVALGANATAGGAAGPEDSPGEPHQATEAQAQTQHLGGLRLYEGGSLSDVVELAGRQLGGRQPPTVLIFHGICVWADGQLEGVSSRRGDFLGASGRGRVGGGGQAQGGGGGVGRGRAGASGRRGADSSGAEDQVDGR